MKKKPARVVATPSIKSVRKNTPGKQTAKAIRNKLKEIKKENARSDAKDIPPTLFR